MPFSSATRFCLFRSALSTPPWIFQRAHRRDDHAGVRTQAGLAALDVDEFLGAQVGAESGFGHDVVGQLQRRPGRHRRIAAVGDVRERPAVHERGVVLERLHQIRLQGVLQEHRHRAMRLQVARAHGLLVARVADDDVAEPLLQVFQRRRQAENRHDFGRHDDVEAILARIPVAVPPSETTMSRSARSFMSTTRFHWMRRTSMPSSLP